MGSDDEADDSMTPSERAEVLAAIQEQLAGAQLLQRVIAERRAAAERECEDLRAPRHRADLA